MLIKNWEKMAMNSRMSADVWYTEQLPLVVIHVYTESGGWKWCIDTVNRQYKSNGSYDSLQIAYNIVVINVRKLLESSLPEGVELE